MDNTESQPLFERFLNVIADPKIAILGLMALAIYVVAIYRDKWRPLAMGLMLFMSMCAPATDWLDRWLQPPPPLDILVVQARPITAVLIFITTITLLLLPRRSHHGRLSITLRVFLFLQMMLCFRALTAGLYIEAFSRATIFIVIFVCMAVLLYSMIHTTDDLRRVTQYLAIGLGIYCVMTLVFMILGWRQGMENGRWFGLSGNPNHNAMAIAVYLPAALGLAVCPAETKRMRMIWLIVAALAMLPLGLSGSRGGLATTAIGILVLFRLRLGKLIFVLAPVVFGLYLASTIWSQDVNAFERFGTSLDTRTYVWQTMLDDWLANPLFGSPGGFRVAENSYLGTLQRLGLFGLLILIASFAALSYEIFRAARNRSQLGHYAIFSDVAIAGITAVAANSFVEATFFSNLNQTIFAIYIYLMLLARAGQLGVTHPSVLTSPQPTGPNQRTLA